MEIKRLDPSNFPTTYVRVVEANGIAYFTDHIAKPEYKTVREQFAAIMARYEELFEKFGYTKKNVVFALFYLGKPHQQNEVEDIWQDWSSGIDAHAIWVPSTFYTDRKVAVTFFVAATDAAAEAARQDEGWYNDVADMFRLNGSAPRLTTHNGVTYLVGSAGTCGTSILEQSKEALAQINALMEAHGLKREHLVEHFSYVAEGPEVDIDAYEAEWKNWVGTEHPPSGVRIQTAFPKGHEVEISLLFAAE